MTIWVFGDSLSLPYHLSPGEKSWQEILCESIGGAYKNFSKPAADNLYIYHSYQSNLKNIIPGDIVIVGWSHPSRKSFVYSRDNLAQTNCLDRSFVYDVDDIQFIRSKNPISDTLDKWINFAPSARQNPYYDIWFKDYYSDVEQKINFSAYYHSIKNTCPGIYVPFFFSKESIKGLEFDGAGFALEFIIDNDCAISKQDSHFNARGHQLWAESLLRYIKFQKSTNMFPVIELFDRLTIAEIKWQKTQNNKQELDWYRKQTQSFDLSAVSSLIEELQAIHGMIWEKESALKSGKESGLPLDEIGQQAIAIRDLNNQRILIKNAIAEKLNCSVREIKQDHLSQ